MGNKGNLEVRDHSKIQVLLQPMLSILDSKNIDGIRITQDNGKVYIIFLKDYLCEVNKVILFKIAEIYNETVFYSNDLEAPNCDRCEYWNPDGAFPHAVEECLGKKAYVFELGMEDAFTILSTGIMIAQVMREQDPLALDVNKNRIVYDEEDIARHDRYIEHGSPDTQWLNLSVILDKNNPLRENPYATFMSVMQINSPVKCDNVVAAVVAGYDVKTYISFNMDRKDLEEAIKNYFSQLNEEPSKEVQEALGSVKKKMLENK